MPMFPSVFYRGPGTKVRAGWRAQIHRGGKRLHSPRFDTKDDAEKWLAERVDFTEEQIGKPPRRLKSKSKPKTKPEGLPGKGIASLDGAKRGNVVVDSEEWAEMRAKQARSDARLTEVEASLMRVTVRCQTLEDAKDWHQACARARMAPPPTLLRRSKVAMW